MQQQKQKQRNRNGSNENICKVLSRPLEHLSIAKHCGLKNSLKIMTTRNICPFLSNDEILCKRKTFCAGHFSSKCNQVIDDCFSEEKVKPLQFVNLQF